MRLKLAPWRSLIYLAVVLVAAAGVSVRTPFSLLAPGHALDLRDVVTVSGHASPSTHYYMTDVGFIPHASPLGLLAALEPGWQMKWTADLVPPGVDDVVYERVMGQMMDQSQGVAAYVAERAAGLPVGRVSSQVIVHQVMAASHALHVLRAGDAVLSVNGRGIDGIATMQTLLARLAPGGRAVVVVLRDGRRVRAMIQTIAIEGKARLDITLAEFVTLPRLPVSVRYNLNNISGSSGGVMFALEIYRSLRPTRRSPSPRIAGTGTLDSNGDVGPIAGTMQKLIAARRAGATLFLVPIENFAEVRSVRDIKIVPIRTFADALQATGGV
ncbi:MAG TPA: PDZ domain-containing protein [Verrucomicrobiae bacterium]|nr:PDZ domain-containing protein [Verrucomicrobiae bacterium]